MDELSNPKALLDKLASMPVVNTLFTPQNQQPYIPPSPPPQSPSFASPPVNQAPYPPQDPYHLYAGGPPVLRFLCFIGGLSMFSVGLLSMLNILAVLTGPLAYIIQSFQCLFGCVAVLVELRDLPFVRPLQNWTREWFKFLTSLKGKGAFYVFVGAVDISLGFNYLLTCVVGVYVVLMGAACLGYAHWAEGRSPGPPSSQIPPDVTPRYQVTTVTTYA